MANPNYPPPHDPSGGGGAYWGPEVDERGEHRERLARERQAEYNQHLSANGGPPGAQGPPNNAMDAFADRPAANGGGLPPRYPPQQGGAHGRGQHRRPSDEASPGLVFEEEVNPRPFGHGGVKQMFNSADKRRMEKKQQQKREYAAELSAQIAEKEDRKRRELAERRGIDARAHGMANVIRDMRDGFQDGVDRSVDPDGIPMYDRQSGHPQPPPQYVEQTPHPMQGYDQGGGGGGGGGGRRTQRPSFTDNLGGGGGGFPGGQPGSFQQQQQSAARQKKAAYQRELDEQVRLKAEAKEREKRERFERDARERREIARYDPWGKGGGGAPMRDQGGNVVTNLKDLRDDYNERQLNPGMPPPDYHYDPRSPGGPAADHVGNLMIQGRFRDGQIGDVDPRELAAKHRQRDELAHALEQQIEEKRRKKEAEKQREAEEDLKEERRLKAEQERLRAAFEKEQENERLKAEERARAEEEAFDLAKRQEQDRANKPARRAPRRDPDDDDDGPPYGPRGGANANAAPADGPPPPGYLPPRGPTPAGARELSALRMELQQEHTELMRAMQAQNENMRMLQERAEMAEKNGLEARMEILEMKENIADNVFLSQLPPVPGSDQDRRRVVIDDAREDYGAFMRDIDSRIDPFKDAGKDYSADVRASQTFDANESMVGESTFVFPGQTLSAASFLGDGVGGVAPPKKQAPRHNTLDDIDEFGGGDVMGLGPDADASGLPPDGPEPGRRYPSDGPPDTAASTASDGLTKIYAKNEARLRALGDAGGDGDRPPADADQLDNLLQNFLRVARGATPVLQEAPPMLEDQRGEFDDEEGEWQGGMGSYVGHQQSYDGNRPDTTASLDTETRFLR